MTKKITIVALVAMMLLTAALPASAAIQATTVEVRGAVWNDTSATTSVNSWNSQNFAGFYYDLKDNLGKENLTILQMDLSGTQTTIAKDNLTYTTQAEAKLLKVVDANNLTPAQATAEGLEQTGTSKGFENGYYYILGWQAEPYVAVNGKVDKLAKLILEQGTSSSDKKTMTTGETWVIGDGWTLTVNSIDAKATPRQVWLTLNKDNVKKDDAVLSTFSATAGGTPIYTYVEKSLGGETDVPVFVTYVDSIFAGTTTDMVQFRYSWLMSESVTKIQSGDTYGVFKNANVMANRVLQMSNTDTSVSLSRDSTVNLMGNMNFKVADSDTLRFYPMVEYEILASNVTPTPTPGAGTPKATVVVTTNVTGVTVPPTEKATEAAPSAAATTKKTEPGFEAVFAIAGLLAVAFLVLRQRK